MVTVVIPIPSGLSGLAVGVILVTLAAKFVFGGVFRLVFR